MIGWYINKMRDYINIILYMLIKNIRLYIKYI